MSKRTHFHNSATFQFPFTIDRSIAKSFEYNKLKIFFSWEARGVDESTSTITIPENFSSTGEPSKGN